VKEMALTALYQFPNTSRSTIGHKSKARGEDRRKGRKSEILLWADEKGSERGQNCTFHRRGLSDRTRPRVSKSKDRRGV